MEFSELVVNYVKTFNLFNIFSYVYWDSFILWSIHWLFIIVYFYRGIKYIIRDFYMFVFIQLQRKNKKYYNFFYSFFKIYFFFLKIFKKIFFFKIFKKIFLKYKIKQLKTRIKKKRKILRSWGIWNRLTKQKNLLKKKIWVFFFFVN